MGMNSLRKKWGILSWPSLYVRVPKFLISVAKEFMCAPLLKSPSQLNTYVFLISLDSDVVRKGYGAVDLGIRRHHQQGKCG